MPKLLSDDALRRRVHAILEASLSRALLTAKDGISFAEIAKFKRFHHYVSLNAQYVHGYYIRNKCNEMLVTSSDTNAVRNLAMSVNDPIDKDDGKTPSLYATQTKVIDFDQTIRNFVKESYIFRIGENSNNQIAIFLRSDW